MTMEVPVSLKREKMRLRGTSGRLMYADQGQFTGSSVRMRLNILKEVRHCKETYGIE